MIKIAVYNQKGVVGKTATVANLAAIFERRLEKKVLCIDCDKQSSLFKYLTTYARNIPEETISDVCAKEVSFSEVCIPVVFEIKSCEVDTDITIARFGSGVSYIEESDGTLIKEILKDVEEEYDICLFDMPPSDNQYAKPSCLLQHTF